MKLRKMAAAMLAATMFGTCAVQTVGMAETAALADEELPAEPIQVEDTFVDGNLKYEVLEDGTLEVRGFSGETVEELTIPAEVKGKSVTTIGREAFARSESLTSVTIPDSVTTIGTDAFFDCSSLESILVEENNPSYSSVNGVLFNKDKSVLVCYPAGKKDKSYTIPDSVTTMETYAFFWTALTSVTIPKSLNTDINLLNNYNLTEIKVDPENTRYLSEDGVLFSKDKTELILYPKDKADKYYTVPDGVTTIKGSAVADAQNLISMILPDSVKEIGRCAFSQHGRECSLKWIYIPESVTSIVDYAFTMPPMKSAATSFAYPLSDIYYGGSEENWEKVNSSYSYHKNVTTIHYNCVLGNVTDKATEINATGIFTADVNFSVKSAEDQTNDTQYTYEIAFTKADGTEVQPESEIVIRMPVPEIFKDTVRYVYVRNSSDGENTPVDFDIENGMIVFAAENIKVFTIEGEKSDTSGNEGTYEIVDEDTDVKVEISTEDKELDGAEFEVDPADHPTLLDLIKKIIEKVVDTVETATEDVRKSLDEAAEAVKNGKGFAYDMGFKKDGKEVQPDKSVTVSIPVPDEFKDDIDKLNVYHLTSRGAVYVPSWVKNGCVMFKTDSFSPYVITVEKLANAIDETDAETPPAVAPGSSDKPAQTPNGGNQSTGSDQQPTGITLAIVPVVLAAGLVAVCSKKRK